MGLRARTIRRVHWLTLVVWLACVSNALAASAALDLFLATDSEEANAKSPSRYDRVPWPPLSGRRPVYVERRVALSIPVEEIESVTIVKKPFAQSMEDAIRQLQGLPAQTQPGRAAWETTFVFAPKAARRLADLMNAQDKSFVDVRLDGRRLGIARVMGPFAGRTFQLYLAETDRATVQRLFRSVEKKIVWQDAD